MANINNVDILNLKDPSLFAVETDITAMEFVGRPSGINKKMAGSILVTEVLNNSDLDTFSGVTVRDNATIKEAIQDLETALEAVSGGGWTEYDCGNNGWVVANGSGVTFAKDVVNGFWTFSIPSGVDIRGGWVTGPSTDADSSNDIYLRFNYAGTRLFNQGITTAKVPVLKMGNGQVSPSTGSPSYFSNTLQYAITSVGSNNLELLLDNAGTLFANLYLTFTFA